MTEAELSQAARDVLAERRRQIEVEGWTAEHDDQNNRHGEMARAAGSYALEAGNWNNRDWSTLANHPPGTWPWSKWWWKPGDNRRMLVKAAALCLAAIEQIDRAKENPNV